MTSALPTLYGQYNTQYGGYGAAPGQPAQPGYYQQQQPGAMPPMPPGAQQPQQQQWMVRPQGIPGCPPGLEYLTQVDQLLVHQQVELLEAFTGWETKNKYQVKNSLGQQVYFAAEESDMCMRQCCGPGRGFQMHITDNMGQEVVRVNREFKCCAGCCWCAGADCCAMEVSVESPPGQVVGHVRQATSGWAPKYTIMDAGMKTIFEVNGPCCICQGPCCTWDQDFVITPPGGGEEVGKISKQWTGLIKEMFTDADNFGVTFPMDLDVKLKATLLGAVFLIDFMYFEQQNNNNN
ncbi:phospholipid scramblase 2 isoform X1 [Lingula anatina]|uniref:Phospholipid scramblase n=1 Tax=Lingula anatina TaxID=7574 RepID=A0A1S3HEF3_LINAN|nr:phospholipid scramblase 2 isoform X1 [Lingula anatina]|eukprot:XP_013384452.1 phospholipid scramblase 2 isoform X1 [Lingula anatina]